MIIATVFFEGKPAELVAGRIQKVSGIEATNTLIAFQAYSKRSLEAMRDIGNEELARTEL